MNLSEKKVSNIDEKQIIRGFILTAKEGLATKEEILERYETVTAKIEQLNGEMADLQTADEQLLSAADEQDVNTVRGISEEYGSSEDIQKAAERLYKYSLQPERNSSAVIIDKSKKNKKNTGIIVDLPL